ncbi:MAG TPA: glycosyl hydrolase 108 family protein [Devosiaceae bacterium]|nr:glycosyl hydrolase 108 family protein [Devosiaceae bacterium]
MPDPQAAQTPRFDACLAEVLKLEGGYVDNPADPGGATNLGVTRKTLARWRAVSPWWKLPKVEVKTLAGAEAGSIYKALYWDRCNADALPAGLDLGLFDFAVNSGPERAIKALQAEVGAVPDGFVGPLTLNAIKTRIGLEGVAGLIIALCNGRLSFLQRLAITATFGAGWSRRVTEIRTLALAMAGASPASTVSSTPAQKETASMNLTFLDGYKTYIVGAAMLIVGVAQLLGVALPSFSGQSAGDLLMQGLAVIFLRQGITNTVAKS